MLAIVSLLIMLTLSLLITRVATMALMYTGLSRQTARFQARSAFTGVGFTTSESEKVVGHPVRRRIVFGLMLVGNAGIVTAISTLILGFVSARGEGALVWRLTVLAMGLAAIVWLASSAWFDRRLSALIASALKRYTTLDVRDYASLLHVSGEYSINELFVEPEDWMAGATFKTLRLHDEGIMALAINRADGSFVGAPDGETRVRDGDTLILYGRTADIEALDNRPKGPDGLAEHRRAVREQRQKQKQQRACEDCDEAET